jgi:hypothetical protein
MTGPRVMADAVLLPDGTVAVVGGSSTGRANFAVKPVLAIELFDPASETWSGLCRLQVPRSYHATALLLPDARVLVMGKDGLFNTEPYNYPEHRVELFSPPYLFRGHRPTILAAPQQVPYNTTFDIQTTDAADIASVVLLRAGAATHSFNMDQRHVELVINTRGSNQLVVTSPPTATSHHPAATCCSSLTPPACHPWPSSCRSPDPGRHPGRSRTSDPGGEYEATERPG